MKTERACPACGGTGKQKAMQMAMTYYKGPIMTNLNELTDDELAEKTAEMMGCEYKSIMGVIRKPIGDDENGQQVYHLYKWDPCNDWNDSVATAKALPENAKMILSDDLEEFFHNTYLDDLTPRKLTEFTLKAAGVDVE